MRKRIERIMLPTAIALAGWGLGLICFSPQISDTATFILLFVGGVVMILLGVLVADEVMIRLV